MHSAHLIQTVEMRKILFVTKKFYYLRDCASKCRCCGVGYSGHQAVKFLRVL